MVSSRIIPELPPEELKKIITASTELAKEALENSWLTAEEQQDSMDFLIHVGDDCSKVIAGWADRYLKYFDRKGEQRVVGTCDSPTKVFFIPACPKQCSNCPGVLIDYYCQRTIECPCRCHTRLIRKIVGRTFPRLFSQPKEPDDGQSVGSWEEPRK